MMNVRTYVAGLLIGLAALISGCPTVVGTNPADPPGECTENAACNDSNPCTTGICDINGSCKQSPLANGVACDDGNANTVDDQCVDGACRGNGEGSCIQPNDVCVVVSWSEELGTCVSVAAEEGTACDDEDPTTGADTCIEGVCVGPPCPAPSPDKPCVTAVFVESLQACGFQAIQDGAACDETGMCLGGECKEPMPCSTNTDCDNVISCLESACIQGYCQVTTSAKVDGAACENGDPCTANDRCENGTCVAVEALCNDGSPCTQDLCDDGNCSSENLPKGTVCDDADPCTDKDSCQVGGICLGESLCDDDDPCTIDACDKSNGACSYTVSPGTACDDADPCTTDDVCSEAGNCGGSPLCDDGDVCTVDSCDASGTCSALLDVGADCDDGDPCTVDDTCKAPSGACEGTFKCPDDAPCLVNPSCTNGNCTYLKLDAVPCDDGSTCTGDGTCIKGVCQHGLDLGTCDDSDPCTLDVCSPKEGQCVFTPIPGCTGKLSIASPKPGSTVEVPIVVVRKKADMNELKELSFTVLYDLKDLNFASLVSEYCNEEGICAKDDVAKFNNATSSGIKAIYTQTVDASEAKLTVRLTGDFTCGAGFITGSLDSASGPPLISLRFQVKQDVNVSKLNINVAPITGITTALTPVNGAVLNEQIVTCEPLTCETYYGMTGNVCSEEAIDDGCGGKLLCPCTPTCGTAAPSCPYGLLGDVNQDFILNIQDFICVTMIHSTGDTSCMGNMPLACVDMNCDGSVGFEDLSFLQQVITMQSCPATSAYDVDGDGIHNGCDEDDDGDGVTDTCEIASGGDPFDPAIKPAPCKGATDPKCPPTSQGHCLDDTNLNLTQEQLFAALETCDAQCAEKKKTCATQCMQQQAISGDCKACYSTLLTCIDELCGDVAGCGKTQGWADCQTGFAFCSGYILPPP